MSRYRCLRVDILCIFQVIVSSEKPFCERLNHRTGTYSSAKLQDRLVKHYAGSIVIHTQRGQGMSNIVFSDKLSLGDAIAATGK
jgi:hypothetical protein